MYFISSLHLIFWITHSEWKPLQWTFLKNQLQSFDEKLWKLYLSKEQTFHHFSCCVCLARKLLCRKYSSRIVNFWINRHVITHKLLVEINRRPAVFTKCILIGLWDLLIYLSKLTGPIRNLLVKFVKKVPKTC